MKAKRLLTLALMSLILSCVGLNLFAYDDIWKDGVKYHLTNVGYNLAYIRDCAPSQLPEDYTIPDSIEYGSQFFKVVSIEPEAFNGANFKSVVIPRTVAIVDRGAFSECSRLRTAKFLMPRLNYLTSTFKYCPSLRSVEMPKYVYQIQDSIYYQCNMLDVVNLPDTLIRIGNNAFVDGEFESINIPETVEQIWDGAFASCRKLTSVHLPRGIKSIESESFRDCSALETINFAEIDSLFGIGIHAFAGCISLTSITLKEPLTDIWRDAFINCRNLISVDLPSTFGKDTKIGYRIFEGCNNLREVICRAITPPDMYDFDSKYFGRVFEKETLNYGTLYVPAESVEAYRQSRIWKYFKNISPMAGINDINIDVPGEETKIYDLMGRSYDSTEGLAPGLYIINGKKRLVRR